MKIFIIWDELVSTAMSDKDNHIGRRTVLKTTGIGMASCSVLTMPAVAKGSTSDSQSGGSGRYPKINENECGCLDSSPITVHDESDRYSITSLSQGGVTYIYHVDRKLNKIKYRKLSGGEPASLDGLTVESELNAYDHEDLFHMYNVWDRELEESRFDYEIPDECSNRAYGKHRELGISIWASETFDKYAKSAISGAICSAILAAVSGWAASIAGGAICSNFSQLFWDHIAPPTERMATFGIWDGHYDMDDASFLPDPPGPIDPPAISVPGLKTGYSPAWYDHHGLLDEVLFIPGPHTDLSDEVEGYINDVLDEVFPL